MKKILLAVFMIAFVAFGSYPLASSAKSHAHEPKSSHGVQKNEIASFKGGDKQKTFEQNGGNGSANRQIAERRDDAVKSNGVQDDDEHEDKKVTVCKAPKGNPLAAHTIRISRNALKKFMREGYSYGPCSGQEGDTSAPIISGIASSTATTSALVTWTTDELSNSRVEFDTAYPFSNPSAVYSGNFVNSHSLAISGLVPDTTYYFVVSSEDAAGNAATSSVLSFRTGVSDTIAPIISNITENIGTSTAVIGWTTDEAATSRLIAHLSGTTTSMIVSDPALVSSHSLALSGLDATSTYFYSIESVDAFGNGITQGEYSFTTAAQ